MLNAFVILGESMQTSIEQQFMPKQHNWLRFYIFWAPQIHPIGSHNVGCTIHQIFEHVEILISMFNGVGDIRGGEASVDKATIHFCLTQLALLLHFWGLSILCFWPLQ